MKTPTAILATILTACTLYAAPADDRNWATRIKCELQTAGGESLQTLTWQQGTTPLLSFDQYRQGKELSVTNAANTNVTAVLFIGASATNSSYVVVTNYATVGNGFLFRVPTVGTNTTGNADGWWYAVYFEQAGSRYWSGNGRVDIIKTTSTADGLAWSTIIAPVIITQADATNAARAVVGASGTVWRAEWQAGDAGKMNTNAAHSSLSGVLGAGTLHVTASETNKIATALQPGATSGVEVVSNKGATNGYIGLDVNRNISIARPITGFTLVYTSPNMYNYAHQGYCTDGQYHYTITNLRIGKRTNDVAWTEILANTDPFNGMTGYDHLGDGTCYKGADGTNRLYIVGEHYANTANYSNGTIFVFNADTLVREATYVLTAVGSPQHEVSSCVVDPATGILYISGYVAETDGYTLWKHDLNNGMAYLGTLGVTTNLNRIQGLSFRDGVIYANNDTDKYVYSIDKVTGVATALWHYPGAGELEGIDFSQATFRMLVDDGTQKVRFYSPTYAPPVGTVISVASSDLFLDQSIRLGYPGKTGIGIGCDPVLGVPLTLDSPAYMDNVNGWTKFLFKDSTSTTPALSYGRLAFDYRALNMTMNAYYNNIENVWYRDNPAKGSMALLMHDENGDFEFRVSPPTATNVIGGAGAWLYPLRIYTDGRVLFNGANLTDLLAAKVSTTGDVTRAGTLGGSNAVLSTDYMTLDQGLSLLGGRSVWYMHGGFDPTVTWARATSTAVSTTNWTVTISNETAGTYGPSWVITNLIDTVKAGVISISGIGSSFNSGGSRAVSYKWEAYITNTITDGGMPEWSDQGSVKVLTGTADYVPMTIAITVPTNLPVGSALVLRPKVTSVSGTPTITIRGGSNSLSSVSLPTGLEANLGTRGATSITVGSANSFNESTRALTVAAVSNTPTGIAAAGGIVTNSIPGPGCTDLGATPTVTITGATTSWRAAPTGVYTVSVAQAASRYTYALEVVSTNACTLAAGLNLQGSWTITGTNVLVITPCTGTLWRVYGRGI